MIKIGDYEKIISDRNIFNQVVYTPLSEALRLLDERRKDKELVKKVETLLKGDIPEFFKKSKCSVLFRQIATPNHESRRFISLAKENGLYPVFFEYYDDKFTSCNAFKHSLGQLHIPTKTGKKNGSTVEKITIIDFNKHGSKKLREIKTLWGESLIDFHKKLFGVHNYSNEDICFYDASNWYKNNGGEAIKYYTKFFLLFISSGILFENFLTSKDSEGDFTKKVVLPALEEVINMTGVKPLIVPLEPLDIESENFWYNHLLKVKTIIPNLKHD